MIKTIDEKALDQTYLFKKAISINTEIQRVSTI